MSNSISINQTLLDLLEEQLDKQSQMPADPAMQGGAAGGAPVAPTDTTQTVGEPLPAEMIQQGAQSMQAPPGAASGMPPGPPQDPMMMQVQMVEQMGMLLEQAFGEIIPLMQQMVASSERLEKLMTFLSGASAGQENAQAVNAVTQQDQSVAPKQAAGSEFGQMVSARGRDGSASDMLGKEGEDLRSQVNQAENLATAILMLQRGM